MPLLPTLCDIKSNSLARSSNPTITKIQSTQGTRYGPSDTPAPSHTYALGATTHLLLPYQSQPKPRGRRHEVSLTWAFLGTHWCKYCMLTDRNTVLTLQAECGILEGNCFFSYDVSSLSSVQFSLVAQSWLTLCNPMNRSTPGLPVHHQLPESTQTHAHRLRDAIQASHPLSSPSPPVPNPSQHQGLFQWVNSSHEVANVLEFQLQHQSFQWTPRTDLIK